VICPELWASNFEIKMVPNPTDGETQLIANGNFEGQQISWKLYNAFGVVLTTDTGIATENNLKINMGLDAQKAGVYFLDFTVGELTKSEILIKTK
jgi:hypothetical protein